MVGLKTDCLMFMWRAVGPRSPLAYAVNPVTSPPPLYLQKAEPEASDCGTISIAESRGEEPY